MTKQHMPACVMALEMLQDDQDAWKHNPFELETWAAETASTCEATPDPSRLSELDASILACQNERISSQNLRYAHEPTKCKSQIWC